MITGFYFYRSWYKRIESIDSPMMYEDESCDYLDSLYTYAVSHSIDPDALIRLVER